MKLVRHGCHGITSRHLGQTPPGVYTRLIGDPIGTMYTANMARWRKNAPNRTQVSSLGRFNRGIASRDPQVGVSPSRDSKLTQ